MLLIIYGSFRIITVKRVLQATYILRYKTQISALKAAVCKTDMYLFRHCVSKRTRCYQYDNKRHVHIQFVLVLQLKCKLI